MPLPLQISETFISACLVIEISIRIGAQRSNFWRSPWNILDFFVTLTCVASLVIMYAADAAFSEVEEAFETSVLIARYGMMMLRAIVLIRQGNAHRKAGIDVMDVDFSKLEIEDSDFEIESPCVTPTASLLKGRPAFSFSEKELQQPPRDKEDCESSRRDSMLTLDVSQLELRVSQGGSETATTDNEDGFVMNVRQPALSISFSECVTVAEEEMSKR